MVREITKMGTIRVAMPPHGLIFGGIEAYHLREAFGSVPGLQDLKNGPKTTKNVKQRDKSDFCRIFCRIFSFKRELFSGK